MCFCGHSPCPEDRSNITAYAAGGALKEEDVRAGDIKSQWVPKITIPGIPPEQVDYFSKMVLTGVLLSGIHSAWAVSDEWNRLLPDYKFADAEQFLSKHWAEKP